MEKKMSRQERWLVTHEYVAKSYRMDPDIVKKFSKFCKDNNTTANIEFEKMLNEYVEEELMAVYEERMKNIEKIGTKRTYKIKKIVSEKIDEEYKKMKDEQDGTFLKGQWLSSLIELYMKEYKEKS